jgi:hypothetical protein
MLVHDRSLVHRDDGFWSRRAIAQCTVRPVRIVMAPPLFDDDLSDPARHPGRYCPGLIEDSYPRLGSYYVWRGYVALLI